jgi:hypothetical protein
VTIADDRAAVRDIAAGKARATVAFKNLGRRTTVVLDLVKAQAALADQRYRLGRRAYVTWLLRKS